MFCLSVYAPEKGRRSSSPPREEKEEKGSRKNLFSISMSLSHLLSIPISSPYICLGGGGDGGWAGGAGRHKNLKMAAVAVQSWGNSREEEESPLLKKTNRKMKHLPTREKESWACLLPSLLLYLYIYKEEEEVLPSS